MKKLTVCIVCTFAIAVCGELQAFTTSLRANYSSFPVYLTPRDTITVTVSLKDVGGPKGSADWWVAVQTPGGWYYYNHRRGAWLAAGSSVRGLKPAYQGALVNLSPVIVLSASGIALGAYTLYFGVDMSANGIIDFGSLTYSSVAVHVNEAPLLDIAWAEDGGARIDGGSVPYIHKLHDGRYRLYYGGNGGIVSAISSDSLNFTADAGIRIAASNTPGDPEFMVNDASVVDLPDGRVRMYYKGANGSGGPGQAIHKIFSAISSDGLIFEKEGLCIDSEATGDGGWASVPEAILLPDGRVRIYYVSNDPAAHGGIMSAVSADGLTFQKEEGARLPGFVDPAMTILPDGRFLAIAAMIFMEERDETPLGLYSFVSDDGLTFVNQQPVLLENSVYDPTVVEVSNSVYRVYYGINISTVPDQFNMDIQSISGTMR